MPDIRQLSPSVINKIAAGEVIERPASVVKELVENSVDAGARRIEVTLSQGGSELIRVSDDGCGIKAEQLLLAVASHATSKIQEADDLFQVGTLGFRGEALASIAEVSRFRIVSRTADALSGAYLEVDGGRLSPIEPSGAGVGTTIEVRDLFFNTPVRRKFLKTTNTEMGQATEAFTRIALAYPDRHFVLRHNDRVLYDLSPTAHWPERIGAFFGADLAAALIAVSNDDQAIRLAGYVADPNFNRGNNRLQYLFLNGRCIRDRALQHALTEAYRGLLLPGRFPVAFLRLEMPLDQVDVNVHPTKMEVRFQDSGRIYSQLLGSIRRKFLSTDLTSRVGSGDAVGKAGGAPIQTPSRPAPFVAPPVSSAATSGSSIGSTDIASPDGESPYRLRTTAPVQVTGNLFDSQRQESEAAAAHRRSVMEWAQTGLEPSRVATRDDLDRDDAVGASLHERTYPAAPWESGDGESNVPMPAIDESLVAPAVTTPASFGGAGLAAGYAGGTSGPEATISGREAVSRPSAVGNAAAPRGVQLHNRYLVAELDEGIVVIDQHALHERILYEQLRLKVLAGKLETQGLLVPEPVTLMPAECAAVLDARETLDQLGFEVEPFGGDTVLVTRYPAMLGRLRVADLLRQVVDLLMAEAKTPEPRDLVDEILHMMSCKGAVKSGDRLSGDEVRALLEQRELFRDTHHCPHGRPTALVFTHDELDKRFKRT